MTKAEKPQAIETPAAQNRLLLRVCVVSVIVVTPFLIGNFFEGRILLGTLACMIAGIFVLNAWSIKRRDRNIPFMMEFLLFPLVLIFLALAVHTEGMLGALWCFPAVVSLYLFFSQRKAVIGNVIVLLFAVPMVFDILASDLAMRFTMALVLVSFFTAIFVNVIAEQHREMHEINRGLHAEIEERRAVEARLAEEITERARTGERLEWALEEAHRANQAKSRFLSGLTHELRTPLNAIIGFGQLLDGQAGELTEEKRREYTGYILQSGDRLFALVNQVLDLARIEAGKLTFSVAAVAIPNVVDRVMAEMTLFANERDITLIDDIDRTPLPKVMADDLRLSQALENLISNAIKYNREHGEVRLLAQDSGGSVRILVRDTGPGISCDRHEELFEIFNRLDADTRIEGSGVGLALAKEFVEGMGGRIGLESEIDAGTTFWIELPIAEAVRVPSRAAKPLRRAAG